MKKIVLMVILLSVISVADLLRVEMGGGVWQNEISGHLQYEDMNMFSTDSLGYSDESRGYLWLFIKHPIPILPNIRFEYTDVKFSGASTESIEYGGFSFAAGTQSTSSVKQYDAILYYNFLDNTVWVTLDLGLDLKYMETAFNVSGTATPLDAIGSELQVIDESTSLLIPLAYGRMRFEVPGTGIGFEGNAKYIKYGDSSMLDYQIKADYTLIDVLPIDIGLEVGYRFENIDFQIDDFSSLNTAINADIDGIFAGAVLRF